MTLTGLSNAAAGQTDRLASLTGTLLALRDTADPAAVFGFAAAWAGESLGASECRMLRVDPRAGGLWCLDETGLEVPYLPQPDGPVERALRSETPWVEHVAGPSVPESDLWLGSPEALVAVPLRSNDGVHGVLLLAFARPGMLDAEARAQLQTVAASLAQTLAHADLAREHDCERRRADALQRRAQLAHAASSHLVSVVAHEIRSPLTAIKAYAEALLDAGHAEPEPRERFIHVINEECDRMARLVTDVLDLSRIEAEGRALRLARIRLDMLVEESIETLRPAARERGVGFELDVERGLEVEVEPDLIRRLYVNLIGNAVKYSPAGGLVRVRAVSCDGWWTSDVIDQGPGVSEEDRPRVFERFYRGRPGAPGVEGHGLGLPIAKGIVEAHGGRIWVGDHEPAGARFGFTLPTRHAAPRRARQVSRRVGAREGTAGLLREVVDMVAASMDAETVSLMQIDPADGDLVVVAACGADAQRIVGRRRPMRAGVAGSVAATGRPLLVNDIEADPRFAQAGPSRYRTKSLLCVPLRIDGEVIGVVNVTNRRSGAAFDDGDLALLSAFIERIGSAIERACEHPENGRVIGDAMAAIRSMTALQRDTLRGGRERMQWTRALARELGMAEADVDLVGYVSSVHDVGMSAIDAGRDPAAPLDSSGRQAVAGHPELSVETIRPLGYLSQVRDLILAHHERWDGSGYPRGLRGEAIPLGSRILAVVDAYASMIHGRPYRAPRPSAEALQELRDAAGAQFDPRVVEAMARVISGGVVR